MCLLKLTNINIHSLIRSVAEAYDVGRMELERVTLDFTQQRDLKSTCDRSVISLRKRGESISVDKNKTQVESFATCLCSSCSMSGELAPKN